MTFKSKDKSEYTIHKPWEFLSTRAIERRIKEGINITEDDLPVSPQMIDSVKPFVKKVLYSSRWLNAINVVSTEADVESLFDLKYVEKVEYIGRYTTKRFYLETKEKECPIIRAYQRLKDPYGYGAEQIKQINGQYLHSLGHRGNGELIGVLDGGFTNVDIMPVLFKAYKENRIHSSYDFIHGDSEVFESSSHGSSVLSMMASDLAGYYTGTAPDASYQCMKTENTRGEYRLEEYNWIAGIERLDSLGGRIVNASLGYTTFTDATMNYSYKDLNGESSPASRAARYAYERGIIVLNSIGNSGNNPWKYMGVPSDSEYVLSVGGINSEGNHATFSSYGPTADGRIKPDLSVLGEAVTAPSIYEYDLTIGNGTSYSSPILTGAVASLWSAFPEADHLDIRQSLLASADRREDPNPKLGYGVPDLLKAYSILSGKGYKTIDIQRESISLVFDKSEIQLFGQKELLDNLLIKFYNVLLQEESPVIHNVCPSYHSCHSFSFKEGKIRLMSISLGDDIYYTLIH